jgi:hypothetical protein
MIITIVIAILLKFQICSVVQGECKVVISELNIDNPPKRDSKEFIELEFICPYGEDPTAVGLKLLVIKTLAPNHKPSISFYANLIQFASASGRKFYVIGSDKLIPPPDLAFSHSRVRSSQKLIQKGQRTLFDMLPNAKTFPEATILLHVQGSVADNLDKTLVFTNSRNYVPITDTLITEIKPFIIDAVVYSRKPRFTICTFIETLCPNLKSRRGEYVLTDFDSEKASTDYTLNRCSDTTDGFVPHLFKTGIPTPNNENDCSGARFLLHREILQSFPSNPAKTVSVCPAEASSSQFSADTEFEEDMEYSCSISKVAEQEIISTISDDMEAMVEKAATSDEYWSLPDEASETESSRHALLGEASEIAVTLEEPVRKKMRKIVDDVTEDWNTEKFFKAEWIDFIRQKLSLYFDVNWFKTIPDVKKWIEIQPDIDNPTQTRFFCRLCKKHFDRLGFKPQEKPKLATETGATLNLDTKNKRKNRELLLQHVLGRSEKDKAKGDKTIRASKHQQVLNKLAETESSNLKSVTQQIIEIEETVVDEGKFRVTSNMFRVVYAETQLNMPFFQHENVVKLLKAVKTDIGSHHYDKMSALRMLLLISDAFHRKLVKHIVSTNSPISIILDATTDSRGKHYIIVYFRALEADKDMDGKILQVRPCVYFYKLIELGASEDANAYMTVLQTSFTEDIEREQHFDEKLKTLLVGFGSDGASVMIGAQNGLLIKLRRAYNPNIYGIHCMAHKFNLASGRAWKNEKNFKEFENTINSVYLFYNNRGHKRKGHLADTASEMNEIYYEFSQIFRIRWIASEYSAISKVKKSYTLLANDLEAIITNADKDFTSATVQEAKVLLEKITDKHFFSFMHFALDVLEAMRLLSVRLQKSLGLLIGKEKLLNSFIANIRSRINNPGSEETSMYRVTSCRNNEQDYGLCDNMAKYESSKIVSFGVISLKTHSSNRFSPLSQVRDTFINKLIDEIEKYFDPSSLGDFDAFLPKMLPSDEFAALTHISIAAAGRLANKFGFPVQDTIEQWKDVLVAIVSSGDFERYRNDVSSINFYSYFLAEQNVPWKKYSKSLIETILVIPIGSADAERGFSILKHIKYDRRSRLTVNVLNAVMRVRINGPPTEKFNALPMAKLWISKGHILTDSKQDAFPRKSLTANEKDMESGVDYVFEHEDNGKEYMKKSNIFFTN